MRTAKTLIRWSKSSLGAQPHCWFCHEAVHLTKTIHKTYDRGQSTLPQVIKFWLSKWCFDIRAESLLRLTIFRWFIQVGLFWHSSWIQISKFPNLLSYLRLHYITTWDATYKYEQNNSWRHEMRERKRGERGGTELVTVFTEGNNCRRWALI